MAVSLPFFSHAQDGRAAPPSDAAPSAAAGAPCAGADCERRLAAIAKALDGAEDARAVLAKVAPALDDATLPKGRVRVIELRERRALRLAFVEVRPAKWDPCADGPAAEVEIRALHVRPGPGGAQEIRLDDAYSAPEVAFFQGTRLAISSPTSDVVEVQYTYQSLCFDDPSGQDGRYAELFHLGLAERLGAPRPLDTGREIAGASSRTHTKLHWVPRSEGGTFLVSQVLETAVEYPCTGGQAPGTSCHPVTSCTLRSEVAIIDDDGETIVDTDPAALAKAHPKLAPHLKVATASSLGACKRLARPTP
jgi:hypothetical protein